jgi:hypothetical protein
MAEGPLMANNDTPREDTGAGEKRVVNCPAEEHDDTNAECVCSRVVYLIRIPDREDV